MDLKQCLYLNPMDIHFTQDSIGCCFSDGTSIGKTLDSLVEMRTFVTEIPHVTVVQQDDKYYSKNNRRLWVFRQLALMKQCDYIPVQVNNSIPDFQFTTEIGGNEIVIRGDPCSSTLVEFKKQKRLEALRKIRARRLSIHVAGTGIGVTPATPLNIGFSPRFKEAYNKFGQGKRIFLRAKRKLKEKELLNNIQNIQTISSKQIYDNGQDTQNVKTKKKKKKKKGKAATKVATNTAFNRWQPCPQKLILPGRHVTNFNKMKRQNEMPKVQFNQKKVKWQNKK